MAQGASTRKIRLHFVFLLLFSMVVRSPVDFFLNVFDFCNESNQLLLKWVCITINHPTIFLFNNVADFHRADDKMGGNATSSRIYSNAW